MRWLAGWSGGAPGAGAPSREPGADPLRTVRPIAARLLWPGPDPLWAVGDWRPDEVRLVTLRPGAAAESATGFPAIPQDPDAASPDPAPHPQVPRSRRTAPTARLAVVGRCGATDAELRSGLAAARGGALRHLTAWPGSYTAVLQLGTRTVLLTDLAGVLPVFHTPWCGGTAYATAALPLADLVGAGVDAAHLAARLACPEAPEAVGTTTPYLGVHRVPPGHSLSVRSGRAQTAPYEEAAPTAGGPVRLAEAPAVRELTRSLLEAVRCRIRTQPPPPGGAPGRARIGADLSGGTASTTLALLAAATPAARPAAPAPGGGGSPADDGPRSGAVRGSWARPRTAPDGAPAPDASSVPLTAVTFAEPPAQPPAGAPDAPGPAPAPALDRARSLAGAVPCLHHTVVPAGADALPYADLAGDPLAGPLTDEPGPALVDVAALRARLAAGGADHLTGYGARQALDGHPARLADLVRDRRRRDLVRPVAALARADSAAEGPLAGALGTPVSVLRAARRLARAPYAEALEDAAVLLLSRHGPAAATSPGSASAAALTWCAPGPAARWLSDSVLSGVAVRLRLAARRPAPSERPGERRARLALHRHAAAYRVLAQAAEQYGQRLHAPFLDNQVVRACRLVPDGLRVQPGARHTLLRAVLAGAGVAGLPADWGAGPRPDRASAARSGLRHAADGLEELFRAPLLAELGLIDLPAVQRAVARAADGAAAVPLDGLAELVATELWLRRYTARRNGSCWTGMPVAERRALAAHPG
ncbi:asparagine synthase [Streptacidiphilus sp. ASG 303]|uniref:asparagine synthase-related protein n=1 Tax=Streptacidiphilus sp. ASG 303 TaxID=2896847 RepID=UPI001E658BE9|nr:asparagine synthase-related protein [Streptacidiphilus sp. ASG 303]MCD0486149.1 asparagine synthase [Streptacidiphilus sp. ASG 303]